MKRLILTIVVALLAVMVQAQEQAQERTPFFVQIADPQLGFINKSDDFSPEQERMERIIAKVNRLQPDFVVFAGDLVHWPTNEAREAFDELCKGFDRSIPIYFLPGNHDVGNDATDKAIEEFVAHYGSDRFVHRQRTYSIVGYNSCVIKAETDAEPKEYRWLRKQLRRLPRRRPAIVVAHHPIFVSKPDEEVTYENLTPEMRAKYLALFERFGVDLALAGHLHMCARATYNDIELVTSGPAGRTLGRDGSGITIVTIRNGAAQATYYEIDQIPDKID